MKMLIDVDSRCSDCYGSGEYGRGHGSDEKCETCHGTGREMSQLGRELFDVLKDYFDITPRKR